MTLKGMAFEIYARATAGRPGYRLMALKEFGSDLQLMDPLCILHLKEIEENGQWRQDAIYVH